MPQNIMPQNTDSLRNIARLAGVLYLLLALTALYGFMYVPSQIMVKGDITATAKNMIVNEFLFRTGVWSNVISHVLLILLVIALHRLFNEVHLYFAHAMAGLALVAIPIAFLVDILKITALILMKGSIIKSFPPEQLNDLAMICIKIGNYAGQMIAIYWGLWLIPLGILVLKSGFIPRIFGVLLFIFLVAFCLYSSPIILSLFLR
jgi:hypothetical protein